MMKRPAPDRRDVVPTRRNISFAALFVNVSNITRYGATPCSINHATRYVNVRVLPVPAPAITSTGPELKLPSAPVTDTAAYCCSFNVAR
jgi:hypothetical protein